MSDPPLVAYLVRGEDPVLLAEAVSNLLHELVGAEGLELAVEEVSGEDPVGVISAAVDAAQTPPFLSRRRVVLLREVGRFRTEDLAPLIAYLNAPLATTSLVLVGGGGQLSRRLLDAVRKVGHVIEAGVPQQARQRQQWLTERVRKGPVKLDREAAELVAEHLGEDLARVGSLLQMLEAAYGTGARLGRGAVAPFLGEPGGVAPWELTDAIDRGDAAAAIEVFHRLLRRDERLPIDVRILGVVGLLARHYRRLLRLDGAGARNEAEAASLLGITGSTYPAKKALVQARRLGHSGVSRAIGLLAGADLDVRGARDLPGELVMEVLIARLSRLSHNPQLTPAR